ncbi:extracellular solute-binding protein [Paenibacillus alginolyticus]|uniref:extracellular solute-binding protein n=1 Tax=Paenibacillus alginolyticus TaxID=59839 RepID=UPI000424AC89|nr:extracellular solute-binding protein [Paenibacillus alginolyticus]MCY9669998.1 extracellular solute-binding protein [Paenibacillus alginolyticus]
MKQKVAKIVSGMVVVSMVLTACSTKSGSDATAEQTSNDTSAAKAVTLTIFTDQSPRIENYETNWFTKQLESKLNITLKFSLTPSDSIQQKKQLLFASGEYPEVIMTGMPPTDQYKYGTTGVLMPLNDLIEQYAPNIKKAFQENPDLKNGATSADGNIYSLPQNQICFHCSYSQKMWINQKWLDKLGLKMPETIDDFYNVLKAFKERDPNGNGKNDEIPLSGAINTWNGEVYGFLMNPFIYNDRTTYLMFNGGKLVFVSDKPEYKEGLKYMHKLFAEKLIDPASFTQNLDSLEQIGTNPAEILGAYPAGHMAMGVPLTSPLQKDYVAVPPLKGPGGQMTAYFPPSYNNGVWSITNKASKEQAIAAIKIADYMYTEEGTILSTYGPEGKNWTKAKPGDKDFNGDQAVYYYKPGDYQSENMVQNDTWSQNGPISLTEALREKFVAPTGDLFNPDSYEFRLFKETKDKYVGHEPKQALPNALPFKPEEADEVAQLKTSIQKYVDQNTVLFITGGKDIDAGWSSYVEDFKKLNVDRYIQLYEAAYGRIKK